MSGFTVVLIDSEDGSEGDFVHVESFATLADLLEVDDDATYPGWVDRIVQAAHGIAERDAES